MKPLGQNNIIVIVIIISILSSDLITTTGLIIQINVVSVVLWRLSKHVWRRTTTATTSRLFHLTLPHITHSCANGYLGLALPWAAGWKRGWKRRHGVAVTTLPSRNSLPGFCRTTPSEVKRSCWKCISRRLKATHTQAFTLRMNFR